MSSPLIIKSTSSSKKSKPQILKTSSNFSNSNKLSNVPTNSSSSHSTTSNSSRDSFCSGQVNRHISGTVTDASNYDSNYGDGNNCANACPQDVQLDKSTVNYEKDREKLRGKGRRSSASTSSTAILIEVTDDQKHELRGGPIHEPIPSTSSSSSGADHSPVTTTTVVGQPSTASDANRQRKSSTWSRKSSTSMPVGLNTIMTEPPEYEPQLTPERMRHGASSSYDDMSDDTFSEGESSGNDSSQIGPSKYTRYNKNNLRRKSVPSASYRLKKENGMDYSPENSVTSINSIASLLKEKIMMTFPTQPKPTVDYQLRIFVGFLFLLIVFTIVFSHVYYYQQVLQKEYFPYTRFNKDEKYLRLYSKEGAEIALGRLGEDLPDTDRVYQCLPSSEDKDGSYCFEWMDHARIRLNHYEHKAGNMHCYNIHWESLSKDINLTDCYEDGYQYGHWYGGGRTLGMAWPVELGRVEMSPFITGHIGAHRWGAVLKRYFINSQGVAIYVDPQSPLHVSINAGNTSRLCLQGKYDQYMYVSLKNPILNYTICTSNNMKTLHQALSDKSLWDGLKKSDSENINSLLTEPVWQIAPKDRKLLTDSAVVNYTEDVIGLGYFRQGHVLLNELWQSEIGDFTFDEKRFANMKESFDIIHRRGFKIILTIQPFIGTESFNFVQTVENDLLITERDNTRQIPALTRYKSLRSAGMLDITNNMTQKWLQTQLKNLFATHNIDAVLLDLGSAYDLPHYYQFKNNLTNPDHFKALFTDSALRAVPVLGVSSAISRPPAPVFLSLPSLQSSWESLQVIIPTTLTYGIVGYPFLMPGPVGGDYVDEQLDRKKAGNDTTYIFSDGHTGKLPERELYIRWLELATFLPVIRYSHLPSQYDKDVIELAKNLTALRQQRVNPLLQKYVREALETGTPLIRPLWMLDPSDSICHTVKDEFSVGDELIVAPILQAKTTLRDVYLPAGVWQDGIDGRLRKGSRWLHHHQASLYQVPFFIRMPKDTRF